MKHEIDPQSTSRASAFSMWMSSPMPMVTLTKTLSVGPLCRYARRHHVKFNALMCWCIGKAAASIPEFFLLPEQGKLYRYDRLAVNVIVPNAQGGINSCDIPLSDSLSQFSSDYQSLTTQAARQCQSSFLEECMIIGTSAMIQTELDSITNQYTELFSNPMVMWGRYRKKPFRTLLPVSFQFHHVQMDGAQAAQFLENLLRQIRSL